MAPPDERHRWSQKLENVLEDRDALEAFKRWMKAESPLVEHPINLHFAIIAYKNMCAAKNMRAAELARNLHQKYVSINTGVCSFLQESRKCSAREVVKEVEPNAGEEEDELERYVRQRMADDSNKPSPSYHSPDSVNAHSLRFRRRSPKSSSPERFQYYTISPTMHSSYSGNPYGSNGFAPPPCGRHAKQMNTASSKPVSRERCELKSMAIYDTSGIESMAPSSVSERDDAQRAAVFQKARLLSSGVAGGSSMRKSAHRHHDFSSLPRTRGGEAKPTMTISYKEKGRVPMVAHVPAHPITFKEFRKYLGISSKCNLQFFFKTVCEDGSAPYQLLLVNDDSALLPIYEGRVTAECKSLSDSD
ncbi:Axin-like protein 1 [Toxocara canis]|uniref:Axin-like protein 1 n=1 Tax=Toxocara canis TaxID=6265 RepID=A0A0B2V9I0_TOXCA|nr:Axin-like protein 1 [Toxocara canis]